MTSKGKGTLDVQGLPEIGMEVVAVKRAMPGAAMPGAAMPGATIPGFSTSTFSPHILPGFMYSFSC